jgi:hypothetical protein
MPRSVTPTSTPLVHGRTPYSHERRSASPSTRSAGSDKENASPPQECRRPPPPPAPKLNASQVAFRENLGQNADTRYYDPFQPREKVKDVMHDYRRLIQDVNGMSSVLPCSMLIF